jgi:large subunit ribosomal protein L9
MEVILLERIEKLGQMGDVVNVKNGFARNFLLPRHKALRATKANIAGFETQRSQYEVQILELRTDADAVSTKLDGLALTIIRQASESGQLYGSVAARDIASGVTEAGFTIDRRQVEIPGPIKTLGIHDIHIVLHPEVSVVVRVTVARTEAEAIAQASGRTAEQAEARGDQDGDHSPDEFFEGGDVATAASESDSAQQAAPGENDEDANEAAKAE